MTKQITATELQEQDPTRFGYEYNKWRNGLWMDDWYEGVFDDATEDGKAKGFEIDDIMFSGFWSQGDGASWVGHVDVAKYLVASGLTDNPRYYTLAQLIEEEWVDRTMTIRASGRYCHEMSMRADDFQFVEALDYQKLHDGPMAGADVSQLMDAIDINTLMDELQEHMLDDARAYAREIYANLEEEYEHVTSEESFIEYCDSNDVVFEVEDDEESAEENF